TCLFTLLDVYKYIHISMCVCKPCLLVYSHAYLNTFADIYIRRNLPLFTQVKIKLWAGVHVQTFSCEKSQILILIHCTA
uniref:Uncharacterized protein n=1 Tax=Astyanax mexicanus TaxID=7994 RepID=A0A3B1ITX2_ASTMX